MTSEERTGGEHGSRVGRPSAQQDKHPSEPRTNWMSGKAGWCSAGWCSFGNGDASGAVCARGERGWVECGHERKLAQEHSNCLEESSCHACGDALRLSPRKNPSGTSTAGRLQLATVLPVGQWKHGEFPFQFHLTQLQTSPTIGIPQIPSLCQGSASAFMRVSDKLFICRTQEVYPARQRQSHPPEKTRGLGQEVLSGQHHGWPETRAQVTWGSRQKQRS